MFKFLRPGKKDTVYDQIDLLYPPAFNGVHSSDLSLVTITALYVPLIQYNIELGKLIYVLENNGKLSPINYRHTAITISVSEFFLTKDNRYGQEVTGLETFRDLARRYFVLYDELNKNIIDDSDRDSRLLILSKVTADLNQLIYSLVSVNQIL